VTAGAPAAGGAEAVTSAGPATRRRAAAKEQQRKAEQKERRKADRQAARRRANELRRLRRRHEELEGKIDAAERELAELDRQISAAGEAGDLEIVHDLGWTYRDKQDRLQRLLAEWEQIGGRLEEAEA
jgi:predicted RNase H-like nuclease (RuvC/YqgF family)